MLNRRKFIIVTAGVVTAFASGVQAAKWHVGLSVPASKQVSMDKIDHSSWNALLQKYVDERGRVNYKGLKASSQDTRQLDRYLNLLSTASTTKTATKKAKLAFWINAYNAVTIKGILREYPTTSIRNHTAKFFGYNIWKELLLRVGGKALSLEGIEHQVLRKMSEPRIHFAIVCASHSCPRLLNQAYTAEKLEEQLAMNSKDFFANRENFKYDVRKKQFQLSSILSWFAEDFGKDQAAQLRTIAPYLPDAASQQAARSNSVSVSYMTYDWSLNEQKSAASKKRQR